MIVRRCLHFDWQTCVSTAPDSTAMDSTAERRRRPMVQKQRPAQLHRLTELHPSQHAATMKTVLDRADRTTRTTACAPRISTSTLRTSHQREMQRIYVESAVQLSNTMFAEQRQCPRSARIGFKGPMQPSNTTKITYTCTCIIVQVSHWNESGPSHFDVCSPSSIIGLRFSNFRY